MKIAVTYDQGNIFQHFGHTEEFKVYEVEDGKVLSSQILASNGSGHGALAGLLGEEGVDVLICGGIGGGAHSALMDNGIEVYAGAEGSADDAVEAYLKGELTDSGVNCDHHGEDHKCGDHHDSEGCSGHHQDEEEGGCEGDCASGGCGSCSGCHPEPLFEGKNVGKTCRAHYKGTFNDGTVFDSSYDRGEPIEFTCGYGMMIKGFDMAVANMEIGEIVNIHLTPDEAYGEVDPEAIFTLNISDLPGSEDLTVGQQAYLQDYYGRPFPVKVVEKDDTKVTFDANHEMAGKELNFQIELVEVTG